MTTKELLIDKDGYDVEVVEHWIALLLTTKIRAALRRGYMYFNPILYKKVIL